MNFLFSLKNIKIREIFVSCLFCYCFREIETILALMYVLRYVKLVIDHAKIKMCLVLKNDYVPTNFKD